MIHKTGDLFTTTAKGLAHGVNLQGKMGAGIAKEFRKRFPTMYEGYQEACRGGLLAPGSVLIYRDSATALTVFNVVSQDLTGPHARLDWLRQGLEASAANTDLDVIAMPLIGCGIGGLTANEEYFDTIAGVEEFFGITFEIWSL